MSDIRDRILTATARLYAENGFRGTTTRRVATDAGVSEITLFRHFGTKDVLIKEALSAWHSPLTMDLPEPGDPRGELFSWAWGIFEHWYRGRHLICRVMGDLVEHPEIAPTVCQEPSCAHDMVARYLERLRERGLATAQFDADAAAGMLLGAVFTHAVWRDQIAQIDPDLPPPREVIGSFVDMLLGAVGAKGAPRAT